jgi:valyl-tRNA synthetase
VPELAKTYDPVGTEARWQQAWDEQGAFHPDPAAEGEPFAVVNPAAECHRQPAHGPCL